jgi:hypothetical protein
MKNTTGALSRGIVTLGVRRKRHFPGGRHDPVYTKHRKGKGQFKRKKHWSELNG